MNKKLLILCLAAGISFTSCEKESVSESVATDQQLNLSEKVKGDGLTGKIHEPPLTIAIHTPDWTIAIHTPDWTRKDYPTCGDLLEYDQKNLIVPSSAERAMYGGTTQVKKASIASDIFFCGGLAIEKSANIHYGGVLDFTGEMMVGTMEEPQDLTINNGGHLDIHGTLYVTGNLVLNNGARMKFKPCSDTVEDEETHNNLIVLGEIIKEGDAFVEGEYIDHSDHDHSH